MNQYTLEVSGGVLGLMTVAMALVMLVSNERSRINTVLFIFIASVGVDLATIGRFLDHVDRGHPSVWARLQGLTESTAIAMSGALVLALLATARPGRWSAAVRGLGRAGIVLGLCHAIAVVAWPAARLDDYELSLFVHGALATSGFWLFATLYLLSGAIFLPAWALLAVGGIDAAEERRAASWSIASAFIILATALPPIPAGVCVTAWLALGMYGHTQYVAARARRGVFLSRFLSPRVAELVSIRGLEATMSPHNAELTVVCADLRGFTSYSEGVPSQAVVDLLAEYYDAVGNVVARHGGTITNYAGDGILILVGAPLSDPSHAATGITIAREILAAVEPVIERWQTRVHALGIGVGVASGNVTVGAIAAETRMEYTAIGMPVNLSARLCAKALAGEVLIDSEAARRSSLDLPRKAEMEIKGFRDAQTVYAAGRY